MAAPAMPSGGNGPQPSTSAPHSGICNNAAALKITEGTAMLPVPRTTLARILHSHTVSAPPNTMLEYAVAWCNAASLPPSNRYNAGPASSMTPVNSKPKTMAITAACHASRSARSASPAPNARAMADDTPPPIAPADIICIRIRIGNTSATPARPSVPSLPINHASAKLTSACINASNTLGAASAISVGSTGAASRRSRRCAASATDTSAAQTSGRRYSM